MACEMALQAVQTVVIDETGRREIDIKRYAKVEKIPGGMIEESEVLRGIMVNKDVTHPKMRRCMYNQIVFKFTLLISQSGCTGETKQL